jgi:16S rRNA (guanine527-N7)-methyltransferase
MTPDAAAQRFNVSRESLAKLQILADLVAKWNPRINLVASASLADIWQRHIADSLQLQRHLPVDCKKITDLGSGAGFPGLVLAIATGIETTLVESNAKKAAFLAEVIRRTRAPARVLNGRIEKLAVEQDVDAVTARALAPLAKLIDLAFPLLSKGAIGIFLKGQDVEAELTQATKYWKIRAKKYPSATDPHGVVLVVEEVERVQR